MNFRMLNGLVVGAVCLSSSEPALAQEGDFPAESAPAYSEPAYSEPAYSEPAYSEPAYTQATQDGATATTLDDASSFASGTPPGATLQEIQDPAASGMGAAGAFAPETNPGQGEQLESFDALWQRKQNQWEVDSFQEQYAEPMLQRDLAAAADPAAQARRDAERVQREQAAREAESVAYYAAKNQQEHDALLQAIADRKYDSPAIRDLAPGHQRELIWDLEHDNTVKAVDENLISPIEQFGAGHGFAKAGVDAASAASDVRDANKAFQKSGSDADFKKLQDSHDRFGKAVDKVPQDLAKRQANSELNSMLDESATTDEEQRAIYAHKQANQAKGLGEDLASAAQTGGAFGPAKGYLAVMERGSKAYANELRELGRQQQVKNREWNKGFNEWYEGLPPEERAGTSFPPSLAQRYPGTRNGTSAQMNAEMRFRIMQAVDRYPEKFPNYHGKWTQGLRQRPE